LQAHEQTLENACLKEENVRLKEENVRMKEENVTLHSQLDQARKEIALR